MAEHGRRHVDKGIDARVELERELMRLGACNALAAAAPRGTGLRAFLDAGLAQEERAGDNDGPFWRLTVDLIERLGIWWSPSAASVIPSMTPWCIRDRSARYDQGPEMWGAPRADGYLRDDNSIIKKLPLPLFVDGPPESPFAGRKPWRGFTACHIWRELDDGTIGGTDPWTYSFMANLVWLPTPLAPLTDHHPRVKDLLQRTARRLHHRRAAEPVEPWAHRVWSRLVPDSSVGLDGRSLALDRLAIFRADDRFVTRRLAYLDKFVAGVDEVLATGVLRTKLICSRYTTGMPRLERDSLGGFRDALAQYAGAVRAASTLGLSVDVSWTHAADVVVDHRGGTHIDYGAGSSTDLAASLH